MPDSDVTEPEVHPDFLNGACKSDITLVSDDGTLFYAASSQLADASGWFRALTGSFSLPQGDPRKHGENRRIGLPEDTLTVEIQLKICCGRAPRFSQLINLSDLERCLIAAEKYDMPGATEVLLLLLHTPAMQFDALFLYKLAGRYGREDVAAGALKRVVRMQLNFELISYNLDGPLLGRLVARRQERIERFCALLARKDAAAPFYLENTTQCTRKNRFTRHERAKPEVWTALVLALQTAFIKHPSVDALESDEQVQAQLAKLEFITCGQSGCNLRQYEWRDIRLRLSDEMDDN